MRELDAEGARSASMDGSIARNMTAPVKVATHWASHSSIFRRIDHSLPTIPGGDPTGVNSKWSV